MKKVILAAISGAALISVSAVSADEKKMETPAPASMDKKMPSKEAMPVKSQHKKHHKHHHHHHGMDGRAEINGVYVTLPVNVNGQIEFLPEYYAGNKNFPYLYHGGYFWYPHARNDIMAGYTPHCANGKCWYSSYVHPHMHYVQGENMVVVLPHRMDGVIFEGHNTPMMQKWGSAPVVRMAE